MWNDVVEVLTGTRRRECTGVVEIPTLRVEISECNVDLVNVECW